VKQFKIGKIVHIDLEFEHDDNSVPPQTNGSNITPERELSDTSTLLIVPNHDLVGRIPRCLATTHKSQDVAPE
jgi:hypothetical protein